jgi:hypothetical protein
MFKKLIVVLILLVAMATPVFSQTIYMELQGYSSAWVTDSTTIVTPLMVRSNPYTRYQNPSTFKLWSGKNDSSIYYKAWKDNTLIFTAGNADSFNVIVKGGYGGGTTHYVVPICSLVIRHAWNSTSRTYMLPINGTTITPSTLDTVSNAVRNISNISSATATPAIYDYFFEFWPKNVAAGATDTMTITNGYLIRRK